MNKQSFLLLSTIVLLISNLLLASMLWFRPHGPGPDANKNRIIQQLHLDAAQQEQYSQTVVAHRKKMHENEQQLQALRKLLYSQLQNDQPLNIDSITELISQKGKDMEQINYHHFLEIKQLCKPEQRQDFNALSEELADMFHAKPHRR
jgi:hypothetical protein